MLKPINDVALIEIEKNPYKVGGMGLVSSQQKEGIETGIVVDIPDELPYLASNTWSFENSFANTEALNKTRNYYKTLIGKKVYWEAFAERGCEIEDNGKTYVLLKFTKMLAIEEKE